MAWTPLQLGGLKILEKSLLREFKIFYFDGGYIVEESRNFEVKTKIA